jgi:hypothetical protein
MSQAEIHLLFLSSHVLLNAAITKRLAKDRTLDISAHHASLISFAPDEHHLFLAWSVVDPHKPSQRAYEL